MPPKKLTRGSSMKASLRKKDGKEASPDLDFLQSLTADCRNRDVRRLLDLLFAAREKKQKDLLVAACEAISRVCSTADGLVMFQQEEGVERIAKIAADPPEGGGKYTIVAVQGLCTGVVTWLDEVDPIDYDLLNYVMHFSLWLGGVDEDVAVSAVGAMERYALHMPAHAAGMLQAGVLNLVHGLLAVHHRPEFVEQVFSFLYLLCDLPAEAVAQPLLDELEIIGTVVEMLVEAPLNMKLQLTGLRLLAMWCTRLKDEEEITQMIKQAGAPTLFEGALEKLEGGGFAHYAAWVNVVGVRCFGAAPGEGEEGEEAKLAAAGGVGA